MTEEENLRELDKRLRNQIQNLLESKEGRNLWAGEIQFQSIQLNNSSASISCKCQVFLGNSFDCR